MSKTSQTILAFISGAAIGAGISLLYAPEKGKETRRRLSEETGLAREKAKAQWNETYANVNRSTRKILTELEEKINQSLSSASSKADDLIATTQKRLDELREQNKKLQKAKQEGKDTDSSASSEVKTETKPA